MAESVQITTPEAMLRFRCNEKGCCCAGWKILFTVREATTIAGAFSPERRMRILKGARPMRDAHDGGVTGYDLRRLAPDGRCQFLQADARCEVHATLGEARLPALCRVFPGFAFDVGERRVLSWDPCCPEVLERLDEDGPYAIVTVDAAPGTSLHTRSVRAQPAPPMGLGGRQLNAAGFQAVEAAVRACFDDPNVAAIDQLAQVNVALTAALAREGEPTLVPMALDREEAAAFDAFLDVCVEAHGEEALARFVLSYGRFIHAVDLGEPTVAALTPALAFDPNWRAELDPRAPALQPLLRRYLLHRFFNAFERSPHTGDVAFNYQTVNHTLATGFRIALGLARYLGRPVDRAVMKVGIGCSEFILRSLNLPAEAMPWFGFEVASSGEP